MIGRKRSLELLSNFTDDYVDKIKKVDIDIFDSGKATNIVRMYNAVPGTNLAMRFPIKIAFMDKTHLIMRFRIDVNNKETPVKQILLDDEVELKYQGINDALEHYVIASAYPSEVGRHKISVELENGQAADFEFYILYRDVEKGSNVDIPTVSYRNALLNVTKLWLLSNRFDRVRNANWAGFFDDRCRRYPMNDAGKKKLEEDLVAAMYDKIKNVIISEATATPLPVERGWDVSVVSTDMQTSISLKNLQNLDPASVKISENEDIIKH